MTSLHWYAYMIPMMKYEKAIKTIIPTGLNHFSKTITDSKYSKAMTIEVIIWTRRILRPLSKCALALAKLKNET